MRFSVLLTAVLSGVLTSLLLSGAQPKAYAHCEIPCGIYGDHMRIEQMLEHCDTIEKSVRKIRELSGKHDALAVNQAARWVTNKEEHATKIQDIIAQYYMHQRIKPVDKGSDDWDEYAAKLAEHHAVMVNAMKTKQTVDLDAVAALRESVQTIAKYYPEHEHEHADAGHSHGG